MLLTPRLVLREWRNCDLAPFAELIADPEVMRYFPRGLSRAQSDEFAGNIRATLAERGWGLWAVEVADLAPFIGLCGAQSGWL